MSLFIGNVSKKVTQQEFEEAFKSFGNCKIDLRVPFITLRKDMPSYSSRVRDVRNRPGRHSKILTSADFASISSGRRIQDDSMKIKALKMTVFVGKEAILEKEVGGRRIVSSVAHHPMRNVTHQPTLTMMTISRPSFQSHQETLSICTDNQTHQKTTRKARRRINDGTLGTACG